MDVSTEESNIETAETRSETRLVMNGTGPRAEVVDAVEINRDRRYFFLWKSYFNTNFYLFGHSHSFHIPILPFLLHQNCPGI